MYTHQHSIRQFLVGGVLALLLLITAAVHTQAKAGASATSMALNEVSVLIIDDSPHTFKAAIFPDLDQYPDRKAMMPEGVFAAITRTYLIKTASSTVLIDSGWGTESGVDGKTVEILQAHGIMPEAITDILLTHMDIDHISGLIHQGQAVYPHAKLHIAKDEYAAWITRGADRSQEHIALARRVVAAYDGRISIFEYGQSLAPHIIAREAAGHTGGHTIYDIDSGDKGMTIVGDMLHVEPIQLRYTDYCSIYDANPALAAQTRERVLSRLSAEKRLVAGMHFTQIGQVQRNPEGGFSILKQQ